METFPLPLGAWDYIILLWHSMSLPFNYFAPETPGFRTWCPDETRRGVEIVVENLHKSNVNSSYIHGYIILAKDLS